jgi:uncharacterized membrane protein
MHLAPTLIPAYITIIALLLLAFCLVAALYLAPWAALRQDPGRIHMVAGGALGCLLLWLLNISVLDGMMLHLLGITTLTLAIGWSLTILAGSLSLLALTALSGLDIAAYPMAWVFNIMVPASATVILAKLLYQPQLRNPFFYMLGAGFAGGALAVLLDGLLAGAVLSGARPTDWLESAGLFWPMLLLMMFAEGFINGLCISATAVFFPDWLKTFDDKFYLDDRAPPRR